MGAELDLDAMSDEEFDALLMDALDFNSVDGLYDYLDSLSDDEFNTLLDELFMADAPEDAQGMFNSVTCAEEVPFSAADAQAAQLANAPAVIQQHFADSFTSAIDVCDVWDVELSGPIEDEIVNSSIPTLILVGEYDVATPPRWATLAAEGLSNVYLLEFPGMGHAIIDATPCAREVGVAFVNAPNSAPNRACVDAIGAPNFYIP